METVIFYFQQKKSSATQRITERFFFKFLEAEEFEEKVNRFVFFATNGCGDYYCYRVLSNDETDTTAIYIWEHELFEIREVAKDIAELITTYYNNEV